MINTFSELSKRQREAVACPDNAMVVAGPGSGKTAVLAWKVGYLLRHVVKPPFRVAAITFTNDAAAQIRDRVSGIAAEDIDRATFGTIHAFCLNAIVRPYAKLLDVGLASDFDILDSAGQRGAVKTLIAEEGLSISEYDLLGGVRGLKARLEYPDPTKRHPAGSPESLCLLYQRFLAKSKLVDFDDLVWYAYRIVTTAPGVKSLLGTAFPWLVVDEYQDTDPAQHKLLVALKGERNRVFAVGDPDQSIYRFRHTDPRNIDKFVKEFKARRFELAVNYRSPKAIAEAAARLISKNSASDREPMEVASQAKGARIHLHKSDTSGDEAEFIVKKLWPALAKDGVKPADFAIFARNRDALGEIIEKLKKAEIKYRFVDDIPYEETVETRIVAGAVRYFSGNGGLEPLRDATDALGQQYPGVRSDFAADRAEVDRNANFVRLLDDAKRRGVGPAAIVAQLLQVFKLDTRIAAIERSRRERERRHRQLDAVQRWVEQCEKGAGRDPARFLAEFDLADSVRLMTVHRSKGLEFRVVCMAAIEEGVLPSWQAVKNGSDEEIAEERRVMYVGMTRAKEALVLSYALQRYVSSQRRFYDREASRFIEEIPKNLVSNM